MLERLVLTAAVILVGLLVYRFNRPMFAALRRFDLRNRERIEQEARDKRDMLAHFRHTLGRAEEQVEAVSEIVVSDPRTATPVRRYLFEGEQFTTRAEAERVRADKVRAIARGFYIELPTALAARRDDGKLN